MQYRSKWFVSALMAATVLVMTACGGAQSGTPGPSGDGQPSGPSGKVVVAQGVDATTLDPHMHAETPTRNVLVNVFDALTYISDENELQPGLAESWSAVNDTTWEFKIRQGVKFHNGAVFTAEDAAFSILRVAGPDSKAPTKATYSVIQDAQVVDDQTIHVTTATPFPILPSLLSDLSMVSKQYATEHEADMASKPNGTGPFQFVSWTKDQQVVLEAFEQHWRGAPAVKTIVFRPIPEAATRMAELATGGVDIITNVPPHTLASIESSGTARVEKVPSIRFVFVGFNLEVESPLQKPEVRQALNYAIDKEAIIRTVLMGNGYAMSQPVPAAVSGYNAALNPYPYDVQKAKELLAKAGYPNGFTIEMMTPNGRYLNDKLAAEAIAGELGKIGIKVDLKVMEWGNYVDIVINQRKPAPLYFLGWSGGATMDADNHYFPLLRTGQRLSYFSDPALDAIVDEGRSVLDQQKRLDLYKRASELTYENPPWLYLWNQQDLYGVSNKVDWKPVSFEQMRMHTAVVK